jgi:predicted aspartyl protease
MCSTADADGCKLQRIASLDFTENGSIIVPVSLEGTSVRMALDTGAPLSAVDPIVAHNLHLVQRRIAQGFMYDIAGEPFTYIAVPHDLALGDMHASGVDLMVWPSPMGGGDGRIGGTLAADLLRHYDVDIDFASHKLSLFSQDHCPGKVVYWTSGDVAVVPVHVVNSGHIIVPVKLDGQPFDAVLDTGSTFSFISQATASGRFHLTPNSPDVTKVGDTQAPGAVPLYRHVFKSLELEGITIGNPVITMFENVGKSREAPHLGSRISDADESGGNTDFILGLNELDHLHLYIAYKEQKLYISPASAPSGAAANSLPPATPTVAATAH